MSNRFGDQTRYHHHHHNHHHQYQTRQNTNSNATNSPSTFINNTLNNIRTNTIPQAENRIREKLNDMPAILTNSQLKNLKDHQYACSGNTFLDPLFQPFWRWLVEQMPMYLAPNLITIIGLIINIITSTILMLYSPNATDDVCFRVFFFFLIN